MGDDRYIDQDYSNYAKSLALQRENFKLAKSGMGEIHLDLMADSLENMKSDLKAKALSSGLKKEIIQIEKVLKWYRTKDKRYLTKTPQGLKIVYPENWVYLANKNLTKAYESIVSITNDLHLL